MATDLSSQPVALRRLGVLSPFDDARQWVDRWEKECPDAIYIALLVNTPGGFEYAITGQTTQTEAAGIFFRAAQLAAE
ncbi:MAG: hypothetical protein NUV51_11000 [Sulfuricaulis sp.]|nr:hypothetical protein [Sulfuricaulis sp.]